MHLFQTWVWKMPGNRSFSQHEDFFIKPGKQSWENNGIADCQHGVVSRGGGAGDESGGEGPAPGEREKTLKILAHDKTVYTPFTVFPPFFVSTPFFSMLSEKKSLHISKQYAHHCCTSLLHFPSSHNFPSFHHLTFPHQFFHSHIIFRIHTIFPIQMSHHLCIHNFHTIATTHNYQPRTWTIPSGGKKHTSEGIITGIDIWREQAGGGKYETR